MRFSFSKNRSKTKTKKTILFVRVENAGRSQMAEGFFRKYAPDGYEPMSTGTKPTSRINPIAIQVMGELGIDISQQKPKDITEEMMRNSDKIVNMGCMDENFCPTIFIPRIIDWGIDEPKDQPIGRVREIRDKIERRVQELVTSVVANKEHNK
jgi:protein-tyrosine-phosphatase